MLNFNGINAADFLTRYWQKKFLVIRNALPTFVNPLSADELAGLALENEVESRLILETPTIAPYWQLKRGPFDEEMFSRLPKTHWTLLVQGVDRLVPEVSSLLDYFNFLPQWRVDDVMISYAVQGGSVGPHYDNYDVFLYQAQGRRKWLLTSQDCVSDNYQSDLELRIMKNFPVEEEVILEEGDMLYLPPHVGHHGISLSDDCMTYSFGYRSYQALELWNSFGDWLAEKNAASSLYQDPLWKSVSGTAELPQEAWSEAKKAMQALLDNETLLKEWFGSFVTSPDQNAELLFSTDSCDEGDDDLLVFSANLKTNGLERNPLCRLAYQADHNASILRLFINGSEWDISGVTTELVKLVANNRSLPHEVLTSFTDNPANLNFLYQLWKLQWFEFLS